MPDQGAARTAPGGRAVHLRPAYLGLVFLGGMGGTLARFGLAEALPAPAGLPVGILLVNLAGAFAMGLLLEALARRGPDVGSRRALRLFAGTGFLGGFTTYSALAADSALLVSDGRAIEGVGYLALSVALGLLATAAGIAAGSGARAAADPSSDAGSSDAGSAGAPDAGSSEVGATETGAWDSGSVPRIEPDPGPESR
ncbi:CrcB family protein [Arthrobacter agilis]|uniref:fluoride efflux transporter FluC n=1 Tax=Arthrobacter agilis TaxID=37921 RepID=UPI002366AB70|nr:CrcB family protein [Arthrobacter agilis]WDF32805.1 CrcB family protein [Arthrobacter agilis]